MPNLPTVPAAVFVLRASCLKLKKPTHFNFHLPLRAEFMVVSPHHLSPPPFLAAKCNYTQQQREKIVNEKNDNHYCLHEERTLIHIVVANMPIEVFRAILCCCWKLFWLILKANNNKNNNNVDKDNNWNVIKNKYALNYKWAHCKTTTKTMTMTTVTTTRTVTTTTTSSTTSRKCNNNNSVQYLNKQSCNFHWQQQQQKENRGGNKWKTRALEKSKKHQKFKTTHVART